MVEVILNRLQDILMSFTLCKAASVKDRVHHICICIISYATYNILTWPCYLGWEVSNTALYTTVNRTACATMNLQTVKDLVRAALSHFAFTNAKMAEMRSMYSKSQCCMKSGLERMAGNWICRTKWSAT